MLRRPTLIAAAAALTLLPACSSGGPADPQGGATASAPQGIVIPTGLTSYAELAEIIDSHSMVVRVAAASADAAQQGSAVLYPNGDFRFETPAIGQVYLLVGGKGYVGYGNGWAEAPDAGGQTPSTLSRVLTGGYPVTDRFTELRASGPEGGPAYVVTAEGPEGEEFSLSFDVDASRILVGATAVTNDDSNSAVVVSYPANEPPLTAPADARPALTDDAADGVAAAISAEASLRGGTAMVMALLGDTPLGELTPDRIAEPLAADGVFVDIETAFDPWSLGFANDGSTIELVSSDGIGTCLRVTIEADGSSSGITKDEQGARTDLGFACSTSISHTGPLLYQG